MADDGNTLPNANFSEWIRIAVANVIFPLLLYTCMDIYGIKMLGT